MKVARMINATWTGSSPPLDKVTNARAESINAGIQKVKYSARGFRNRNRFRNAIYFHLGGLDLYPASVTRGPTHPPGIRKTPGWKTSSRVWTGLDGASCPACGQRAAWS